jgi:hypothetical protein
MQGDIGRMKMLSGQSVMESRRGLEEGMGIKTGVTTKIRTLIGIVGEVYGYF